MNKHDLTGKQIEKLMKREENYKASFYASLVIIFIFAVFILSGVFCELAMDGCRAVA